jgi:hypothetical protein
MRKPAIACATVVLSAVFFVGCGGSEPAYSERESVDATVTGKVTHGGAAVTNATISFEGSAAGAFGGPLGPDGTFTLKLAAGKYKVIVTPVETGMNSMTPTAPGELIEVAKRDDIPEAYRVVSTTKAEADIGAGENAFDLNLE